MRTAFGWWRRAVIALLVAATPPSDGLSFSADAFSTDAFDADAFSGLA